MPTNWCIASDLSARYYACHDLNLIQVTATHHVTYCFNYYELFTIALDLLDNVDDLLKTLTEIPCEKEPPSKA